MEKTEVVKGIPVSATHSIVYEPVLVSGNYIVTIKYKYDVTISVQGVSAYPATINYKIYSPSMTSQEDAQIFIAEQITNIHNTYRTARIVNIDVTHKM